MTRLSVALLALALPSAHGSLQKVAGYSPGSQVTDHCAIDLDQRAMEEQLAMKTDSSFLAAKQIYEQGGHSKSYAEVTLDPPLTAAIASGADIMGTNADGNEVAGKAYTDYEAGDAKIKVKYATTDLQESYVECQVGALPEAEQNTRGCLKGPTGTLKIAGTDYNYTYDPATDNNNGRTIQGFSTGAKGKMYECTNCPYTDYKYFYDYYGSHTYADDWVTAALDGTKTQFKNGNADFSKYGMDGRDQAVKKGTSFLNIFMYVIREFEDALDDCERNCMDCNFGSVHAWDEGVCFYTGSIEGQDGLTDDGKLLHQLADKRCSNYRTCGESGTDLDGMAKVNHDLFDLFQEGNYQLTQGECTKAKETTAEIAKLMYIPMIQGAMRYAYKVDELGGGEVEKAEGASFAAAVLPRVHAADPEAAKIICDNLCVGAASTDFKAVKAAFESAYPAMGIQCADVGGLWNEGTKDYFEGMEPCDQDAVEAAADSSGGARAAVGAAAAALAVAAVL